MIVAGYLTHAMGNAIQAAIFKGSAFPTPPTTLYLAFASQTPNRANFPAFSELASTLNYSRTPIAAGALFTANTTSRIVNTSQIILPVPTGTWATIVGWGLFDAASGGNLWFVGTTLPTIYTAASTPNVAAGALIIQL